MTRVILTMLVLGWAGQAFASGFEEDPCRRYSLSSTQVKSLARRLHSATGLSLDDSGPYACSHRGEVRLYGTSQRAIDAEGSELWYEAHCEFHRVFSARWDCKYIGQRIVRVRGHWPDGEAQVFIPLESDAASVQRRLKEVLALTSTLGEQDNCDPGATTARQLEDLRGDMSAPWHQFQVATKDQRFTFWTQRFAIHFTADAPDQALRLRCWRPKKSLGECLSAACPV